MLPEIELSEKIVEQPPSRQKDVELALNIYILVAYKSNGREKCSSNQRHPKTKKHAFLRASSMGNRDFYVRMGL